VYRPPPARPAVRSHHGHTVTGPCGFCCALLVYRYDSGANYRTTGPPGLTAAAVPFGGLSSGRIGRCGTTIFCAGFQDIDLDREVRVKVVGAHHREYVASGDLSDSGAALVPHSFLVFVTQR
jgi:hypothetical protein